MRGIGAAVDLLGQHARLIACCRLTAPANWAASSGSLRRPLFRSNTTIASLSLSSSCCRSCCISSLPQVAIDVDRHLAGRHFAPHAVNSHAILAGKALRADVHFAQHRRLVLPSTAYASPRFTPPPMRPRFAERADRAARFFDRDIDVRVARPGNAHDAIAHDRFLQSFADRLRLVVAAFAGQAVRASPWRSCAASFSICGMFVGQAWLRMPTVAQRMPARSSQRSAASQTQGVRFASQRFDLHDLLVEQHRAAIETDARQILAMYISSSADVLKSAADITARSISVFERPSSSIAMPSDSYIHDWGWPFRSAALIRAIDLAVLLVFHQLTNRFRARRPDRLACAEVRVPKNVRALRSVDRDAQPALRGFVLANCDLSAAVLLSVKSSVAV